MARKKIERVIYYDDEETDDFAGTNISAVTVDDSFHYIHRSIFWRILAFMLYYLIAFPLIWLFERVIMGARFVNKGALKRCKSEHAFLYGNHTGFIDAFTPCILSFPRKNHTIVSPDAVSIKGLKNIVQMLGAIPVPSGYKGLRRFRDAVDYYHTKGNITIYPEAHIWPYYTGVRHFSDASFGYAVKHGCPVYAFFTAYSKPRGILSVFRRANITIYVSDPIYPDEGLVGAAARKNLCEKVYAFMLDKSQYSDYEVIKYIKREKEGAV